ncbi:MAG: tetratricopeptide repeat protein [Candidatus Obscuribacterales bacterium]|nr:tetratricopeptide repeat protein [Candidatus Obscuribacterales bacterium]
MKCSVAKLSGQMLLMGWVVSLPSLSILNASAQDFSDPATIIMMNAQRRGLVPANTAMPAMPQDFSEPADIIMMNAQRRGLIPGGQAVPMARPAASPTSESTSFTGHSQGPFDGAASNDHGASPFAQPPGGASSGNSAPLASNHAVSGMSAQQIFDRGCDKTAAGNFAEAIKDYDEAIKVDPNFGKAYANRGSAKYNTGDHKGALADFDVAARLMPENQAVSALRDQIKNSLR